MRQILLSSISFEALALEENLIGKLPSLIVLIKSDFSLSPNTS